MPNMMASKAHTHAYHTAEAGPSKESCAKYSLLPCSAGLPSQHASRRCFRLVYITPSMARRVLPQQYIARTLRGPRAHPKKLVRVLSLAANSHKLHGVRAVWLPGRLAGNINISSSASSTSSIMAQRRRINLRTLQMGKHTRLVWAIR
jgi:hypothetical protein